MWILLSLVAAGLLIAIAAVIIAVRSSDGPGEQVPIDMPGEDFIFSERPSYDSYKSLN